MRKELCFTFLDVALLPLIKLLAPQGSEPSPLNTEVYRCIQQVCLLFLFSSISVLYVLNVIVPKTYKQRYFLLLLSVLNFYELIS